MVVIHHNLNLTDWLMVIHPLGAPDRNLGGAPAPAGHRQRTLRRPTYFSGQGIDQMRNHLLRRWVGHRIWQAHNTHTHNTYDTPFHLEDMSYLWHNNILFIFQVLPFGSSFTFWIEIHALHVGSQIIHHDLVYWLLEVRQIHSSFPMRPDLAIGPLKGASGPVDLGRKSIRTTITTTTMTIPILKIMYKYQYPASDDIWDTHTHQKKHHTKNNSNSDNTNQSIIIKMIVWTCMQYIFLHWDARVDVSAWQRLSSNNGHPFPQRICCSRETKPLGVTRMDTACNTTWAKQQSLWYSWTKNNNSDHYGLTCWTRTIMYVYITIYILCI